MFLQTEAELKHLFSMLVSWERDACKTTFTNYRAAFMLPARQRIVWCYLKHHPDLFEELLAVDSSIEYVHRLPSDIESIFDCSTDNIIMLDDMMDEASQD